MRYSLLVLSQEATEAEIGEEAMAWGRAAFDAYARSLDAAGVLVSADILRPVAAAATVSVRDGALTVQDGPFADTKEKLNGTARIRPSAIVFRDGGWHPVARARPRGFVTDANGTRREQPARPLRPPRYSAAAGSSGSYVCAVEPLCAQSLSLGLDLAMSSPRVPKSPVRSNA